jgi:hypothetical protein
VIHHLKARQDRNLEFFFKHLVDGDNHLKVFFWFDSQSHLDYETFVMLFSLEALIYRSNRYNLPFMPFVGFNHHQSTIIIFYLELVIMKQVRRMSDAVNFSCCHVPEAFAICDH